jgi:hypothetical protein
MTSPLRSGRFPAAWLVLLLALGCNVWLLWPQLSIGRIDLNDGVFHLALAERVIEAAGRGEESVLDFWVSEWTLGYPVPRTYQMLGHLVVAGLHQMLGGAVPAEALFGWVRFLLLVLLPATVYATARLLRFEPGTAAAAAVISPLVSSRGLFGLEYGSYVWRGSGLYAQAWGMHLLLLGVGLGFRAIREGRGVALAGLVLGLCFLAHFIYGYMAAASLVLLALLPQPDVRRGPRITRLLLLGTIAAALSAFQLVALLEEAPRVNRSVWEADWKFDSFGAMEVLRLLASGALLDEGRLPVLSLLSLIGAALCLAGWRNGAGAESRAGRQFAIGGGLLWLFLFCGRPAWGVLYSLLGLGDAVHLHRFAAGVHVFFVLVAAVGLASLWRAAAGRGSWPRQALAAALTLLVLLPAGVERVRFLAQGAEWGRENLAAVEHESETLEQVLARLRARPGRVYPGLAAGWGNELRIGFVPLHAFLARAHIPAVAFLYHSMALTSDLMVRFDESNPDHYRLFNVQTVLSDAPRPLPGFLQPSEAIGRFLLSEAPGGGWFDLVSVGAAAPVDRTSFQALNDRWLHSAWVARRQHLWLETDGRAPGSLPRVRAGEELPEIPPARGLGRVLADRRNGEVYEAELEVLRPCFLLFKMTYHPRWQVLVDGQPRRAIQLSPGFVAALLAPGDRAVRCEYRPAPWSGLLLLLGGALTLAALLVERWLGWGWLGRLGRQAGSL